MRVRKNGKVITLTESDLMRITRKVLKEQEESKKSKELTLTDKHLGLPGGVENFKKIMKKLAEVDDLAFGGIIQTDEKGDYIGKGYMSWPGNLMGCEGVYGATPSVDKQWCKVLSVADKNYLSKFIQNFIDMGFLRKDPSSSGGEVTHIGAKLSPEKIYLIKQKEDVK